MTVLKVVRVLQWGDLGFFFFFFLYLFLHCLIFFFFTVITCHFEIKIAVTILKKKIKIMNGNVNMIFPDHVEQVNGLQVMLKGEDQKEGGCRPPPSAAVSEVFMDAGGWIPFRLESGRGGHMDRGVSQPTELSTAPSCA